MRIKNRKLFFSIFGLVAVLAFFAMPVFAQDLGLGVVGENIALGGGDIRATIARIINVALGLLGIVMVGIVVYAGFLYMTSAGDPQKTLKARKWIINSIIGLAIILSAYAITFFVVKSLTEATNPSGTVTGPGGECVNPPCNIGTSGSIFRILSITPAGDHAPNGWPRNSTVKMIFSADVDGSTAGATVRVTKVDGSAAVDGTFNTSGGTLEFVPSASCPPPNDARKCFDPSAQFKVDISTGLKSTDGRSVYCGIGSGCSQTFKTGTYIDTAAPTISMISPANGSYIPQSVFEMSALATDDSGVAKVDFYVDNNPAGTAAAGGETSFSALKDFDATSFALGSSHQIKATAYDVDSNLAVSGAVTAKVLAAHCFNHIQDSTETGIDCGPPPPGPPNCLACPGSGCNYDSDCASGKCQNGVCVAAPVITALLPPDGAPGNLVTIFGRNFGDAPGSVSLSGKPALSGCTDAWSDTQIIMVVPEGASTGKVQVTNKSGLSGESPTDFSVNNIIRPGVCSVTPASGQPGGTYTISGKGFGVSVDSILFNTRLATINSWAANTIVGVVPTLTDGRYVVKVKVGAENSNGVYFNVLPPAGGTPTIRSISPESGPRGEYVTIFGSNFGSTTGNVVFWRGTDAADADISFPDGCGVNYWQDGTIVVKVPSAMRDSTAVTAGSYEIQVIQGMRSSDKEGFTVNDKTPKPGICRLVPDNGPPGRRVNLIGERFGAEVNGKVNFWQNKLADKISGAWSAGGATVKVPAGAQSGPVTLVSTDTLSNGLNFRVSDCGKTPEICVSGEKCCAGSCIPSGEPCAVGPVGSYLWRFVTGPIVIAPRVLENQDCSEGAIQSPSPWKGSTDACTNSEISAQFNVSMNTMIPAGAVRFEDCTGASGAYDAGACAAHPVIVRQITWSTASANDNDKINITTDDLIASHAYQVTLMKTLTSAKNIPMDTDYVWRFRASATGACTLSRVSVAPPRATISEAAQKKDFTAYPAAANCNILKCTDAFGFVWRASDPGIAAVLGLPITSDYLCKATASPLRETGETPVNVIALATTYNKDGRADLFIKYTPPQIVDFWPSSKCPAACTNADVGGEFNVEMDATTVTADNIKIYECPEPASSISPVTCAFSGGIPPGAERAATVTYSSTADHKTFSAAVDLEKGKRYLVRVNGYEVKSASGASLVNLNPAPYFSWQFAVNDNASTCAVDRVELSPLESILKLIGARADFNSTPFGKPDACNSTGPRLKVANNWVWNSSKTDVGILYPNGVSTTTVHQPVEARGPGQCNPTIASCSKITAKFLQSSPPGEKTSSPGDFNVVCACQADADCWSTDILGSLSTAEVGCSIPANGGNQCCYPRPKVISVKPMEGRTGVCRNALLEAEFDQVMAEAGNGEIAECAGQNTGCVPQIIQGDFKQFTQNGHSIVQYYPRQPFKANQWYRVTMFGGAGNGWTNTHGVAMAQDKVWSFKTGGGLCVLDKVEVAPSYYFFHTDVNDPNDDAGQPEINDADAVFSINYISTAGGDQDIVPIPNVYDWRTKWVSNDSTVVAAKDSINRANDPPDDSASVLGIAQNKNGTADIVATVTVTDATLVTPALRTLSASAKIDVLLCENIWPANPTDLEPVGLKDAAYGFRTYYCRDIKTQQVSFLHPSTILRWFSYIYKKAVAQVTGRGEQILDVLPALNTVRVQQPPAPDILKEYLLQNPESRDAIGIRVMTNPAHLSPLRWYKEVKNFKGAPKPIKLDGYEAVQDGRTIYAAGAHQDGGGKIFTNIYILSYNEGAGAATVNIFGQIADNFKLNTNLSDNRVCSDGKTVCASDLDCPASVCANFKRETRGTCNTAPTVSCTPGEPCPASVCDGASFATPGTCNTSGDSCSSNAQCQASTCEGEQAAGGGNCNTAAEPCTLATVNTDCPASVCEGGSPAEARRCSNSGALCSTDTDCNAGAVANFSLAGIGSSPEGIAYDSQNKLIWVASWGSTRLVALNPDDGTQNGSPVIVDLYTRRLISDGATLYAASLINGTIKRIVTSARAVEWTKTLPIQPTTLVYANGYILAAGTSGLIYKISEDGTEVVFVTLSTGQPNVYFYDAVYAGGRVWFSEIYSNKIYGIDPYSMDMSDVMVAAFTDGGMPGALATDGNYIYAGKLGSRAIGRFNFEGAPVSGGYTEPPTPGTSWIYSIIVSGNYVWFSDNGSSKVYKIDKTTWTKSAEYDAQSGTWYLAKDSANIWATNQGANSVTRIAINAPVCNEGTAGTPGTCSGSNPARTCNTLADCAGVEKVCGGALPAGTGTCSGTAIVCADNSVCVAVEKLCNGAGVAVSGKCRGSNLSCTTNSNCVNVAVCADYEAAGPGNCSVGGISCASDAECRAATSVCDAGKTKLTRDVKRLEDFKDLATSLEAYKQKNNIYPRLEAGTFIRSLVASKWGSWQSVFGGALGAKELPVDPINQFRDCARVDLASVDGTFAAGGFQPISSGSNIYYSNGNAAGTYNFVVAKNGIYRLNLNTQNRGISLTDKKYSDLQPSAFCAGSGIYHHLKISIDGVYKGALCNPAAASAQIGILSLGYLGEGPHSAVIAWDNDWYPNYDGVCGADKKCTISKKDCAANNDCGGHYDSNLQINNVYLLPAPLDKDTCWSEADKNFVCTSGSHVYQYRNIGGGDYSLMADFEYATSKDIWMGATTTGVALTSGGAFSDKMQITNTCNDTPYGGSALCGDGVVGTGEECELGQTQMITCSASGRTGVQKQECYKNDYNACAWRDSASCNVGRCGDGVVQSPTESCDDGALNGKYGYCEVDCSGLGNHCGDGALNSTNGEKCDLGAANGQYGGVCRDVGYQIADMKCVGGPHNGQSCAVHGDADCACAWDCSGPGPRCGDGIAQEDGTVQAGTGEECDGNVNTMRNEILGVCKNGKGSCAANSACNYEIRNYPVAYSPSDIAFDGKYAWIINPSHTTSNNFSKIDSDTGIVTNYEYLNDLVPRGVTFDGANIWLTGYIYQGGAKRLLKIDPSNPMSGREWFKSTLAPGAITFDGAYLWMASGGGKKLLRIDPANPDPDANPSSQIAFGNYTDFGPMDIVYGGGYLWVANLSGSAQNVLKINPADGAIVATYNLAFIPIGIAFDGANIWITNAADKSLVLMDPSDGSIKKTYGDWPSTPYKIIFSGNALWVAYDGAPYTIASIKWLYNNGICDGYSPACLENRGYFAGFDPGQGTYDSVEGNVPMAANIKTMKFEAGAGISGSYTLKISTQNSTADLTNASYSDTSPVGACGGAGCGQCIGAGIYHHLKVKVDGTIVGGGVFCAPASAQPQEKTLSLSNLSAGQHEISIEWDNDWYVAGVADSNVQINSVRLIPNTGGRDYVRSQTCSNSCSWNAWGMCKPVGTCGNGAVEPGEECDSGNLDTTGSCVMCKKSRCGDGYVEVGVEQCDAGLQNGVPCDTMYGGTCNYCSTACKLQTRTGPYCGNGTLEAGYGEQCDPNTANPANPDFGGAACESYGFAESGNYASPEGRLQCKIDCGVNVLKCKSCAEATEEEKGDGSIAVSVYVQNSDTLSTRDATLSLFFGNQLVRKVDFKGAQPEMGIALAAGCNQYKVRVDIKDDLGNIVESIETLAFSFKTTNMSMSIIKNFTNQDQKIIMMELKTLSPN